MDLPQPLSTPTASTYSAALPATSAASQEKESSYKSGQTGSNFSAGDAAWVVMRSLSTAAECLNFACRKVAVLSSVCLGGFTGLLQYAHENLGDRTVQKVPVAENSRIEQQLTGDKQPGDKAQQAAYLQNPPVEEYVRQGANKWKHFMESGTSPDSEYTWMDLAGMVISVTLSISVLGIVGTILLHTPHWLFKAGPYINLNTPTPQSLFQAAATLPSDHPDRQSPAPDPAADSRPLDNPASHPPVKLPPTAVTSSQSPRSSPAVETSHNSQVSQQQPEPENQQHTASLHEPLTNAQTTQQSATCPAPFPQTDQQPLLQTTPHSSINSPTGGRMPTSVSVHKL
ncbi:hypothetical protein [Endozoicomonas sp. GU-1]|uniref:hypothetical protein n=1 Tax=Endozoicomonas sp. GU-1 TaxID=3009078 RepID=UPI0022B4E264|nr:hypothetical protein [Endozoicomonas sp. GU-1]WBA82808.1 hypothetical protein O2T12_06675 [Endozoicomonas sp. GU-1]WBA85736.1 hypothetical protein O3276_21320 [Endozoicomonas sp. GU-1]